MTAPIYYDDGKVIHACESSEILPEVRMVWTKCYIDVPDDKGFTADEVVEVTCRKCVAALAAESGR